MIHTLIKSHLLVSEWNNYDSGKWCIYVYILVCGDVIVLKQCILYIIGNVLEDWQVGVCVCVCYKQNAFIPFRRIHNKSVVHTCEIHMAYEKAYDGKWKMQCNIPIYLSVLGCNVVYDNILSLYNSTFKIGFIPSVQLNSWCLYYNIVHCHIYCIYLHFYTACRHGIQYADKYFTWHMKCK